MSLAITKQRKETLVAQYAELLEESSAFILADCAGLSVKQLEALRHQIREVGGKFHIVKNTLVKRAFEEVQAPLPEGALAGPTAIGFAFEDVIGVAKALVETARETEILSLKGAVIEGNVFDAHQVRRLAELPPMPVVQAQLLGLIQTVGGRLAGVLAGSMRQVVNVVHAYSESEQAAA